MKVVVIGAGLLGLTSAYFLNRYGADVTVVDRQPGPGLETSFSNGGMLHASQANPWNEPGILTSALKMIGREDSALLIRLKALPKMMGWGMRFVYESNPRRYAENLAKNARLARYSINVLGQLRDQLTLEYDAATLGTIKLFRDDDEMASATGFLDRFEQLDIPYEKCDARKLVQHEPALDPIVDKIAGGLYFPADESGDAFKFCQQLYEKCVANDVHFAFGQEIEKLTSENGTVKSAISESEEFVADKFLVAAGSYTAGITRSVKVNVPVQPVKGYSITVPVDDDIDKPKIPVIDEAFHAAVCPLGTNLRVAGTAEFAGFDKSPTASRVDNLHVLLNELYPEISGTYAEDSVQQWSGLRPMSPDGVGIMGATELSNLYLNCGHGHLGWTMAAGAGLSVAELIAGADPEFSLSGYGLSRFK